MKRILILLAAMCAFPAHADTIQSLNYNTTTGQIQALTKANGTKPVNVAGGASPSSVQAITASYTVTNTDGAKTFLVTTGSSTITMTLPSAAANKGREITFKKADNGTGKITVSRAGTDTIEGSTTVDYCASGGVNGSMQYCYATLLSDGSTWQVIGTSALAGTWTPTIAMASGTAGTWTGHIGYFYTVIGDRVCMQGYESSGTTGNTVAGMTVSLPFTAFGSASPRQLIKGYVMVAGGGSADQRGAYSLDTSSNTGVFFVYKDALETGFSTAATTTFSFNFCYKKA